MNRFLFTVLCICSFGLILGADSQLFAQNTRINVGGESVYCTSPNGQPVRWFSRPDLNDVGYTTQQGILYNPTVLSQFSEHLQLFWLGHECGHAHLGTTNESLADCWSARTGVEQGWFDSSDADDLAREMKGNPGDNSHPPGPERVSHIRACMQQASSDSPGDGQTSNNGRGPIAANQPRRLDKRSLPTPKDPTPRNKDTTSMCSKLNEVVNDEPDLVAVTGDDRTPHSTFATTELPLAKDCYVTKTSKPVYKCDFKKSYFSTLVSQVVACFPDASKTGSDLITIRLKNPETVYFMLSTMDDESYIEIWSRGAHE